MLGRLLSLLVLSLIFIITNCVNAEAFAVKGIFTELECFSMKQDGVEYIPLVYIAEANNTSWRWNAFERMLRLYKQGHQMRVSPGLPFVELDGTVRKIAGKPFFYQGTLMVPAELSGLKWWQKLKVPEKPKVKKEKKVQKPVKPKPVKAVDPRIIDFVIIDPGHGGKDCGAIGPGNLREKDLVLQYSHALARELRKRGIRVSMTRERDFFVTLPDRARMSNESGADLFISVHANSHRNSQSNGFEVFYLSDTMDEDVRMVELLENGYAAKYAANNSYVMSHLNDRRMCKSFLAKQQKEAKRLSSFIEKGVSKTGMIRSRGTKGGRFFVLKWVENPSVLLELGFLSNAGDRRRMLNSSYRQKMIKAIADALMRYKSDFERRKGLV